MIKKILIFSLFFTIVNTTFANNFIEKTVDGNKMKYIKYDLNSKDYIYKISANKDYEQSSLRDLMERNNGVSAINGVFFCPDTYKECGGKTFTFNERYVEGEKIGQSRDKNDNIVFALDKDNKPFLFKKDYINNDKEDDIFYGFGNFPLLLKDGEDQVKKYEEAGLLDKKMTNKMIRNFVCSDITNKYIYTGYTAEISLSNLPELLKKIGCYNALNLDAGGSSAFIYNSRYIIGPGRDIMDGVIIERKGLDTSKIIDKTLKIKEKIKIKFNDKTLTEKLDLLVKLTAILDKNRKNIYEKNSIDIFDNNSGKIIGYEINMNSIKMLESVYYLNYLNKVLYDLKQEFKNEEAEKIRIENENKNKVNLLF